MNAKVKLTRKDEIRLAAESDLVKFVQLVFPRQVLGSIHNEVLNWFQRSNKKSHQLLLLPRDHGKSRLAAFYVAWRITRDPTIRVLYISATANLATKQIKFIKDILTSPIYRYYWPEMVNAKETEREQWTASEFSVDHPERKAEGVRDPTVFTAGLTTTITGLHCDLTICDDIVAPDNAYTEEGRNKVKAQHSQLASIQGTDAEELVVGTRYHPLDIYQDMLETTVDVYDDQGELKGSYDLYEVLERTVENAGDGSGEYLWPRQQRSDGKWFGFNQAILAQKRAQYHDRGQFRAQYYNDPNAVEDSPIDPSNFQYYDSNFLRRVNGFWYYKDSRINIFAAVDFAYTLGKRSDSTAIVVIGVDYLKNYYILDIDRFKSDKISEYFNRILRMYEKWGFRKIRAEVTAAQSVIVKDLKENYIREYGLALSVDEFKPTSHTGSKEERVYSILQPRYENHQIWHYHGGNVQLLEEELVQLNPLHDDIKDCLASVIDVSVPPTIQGSISTFNKPQPSSRFGGYL